MILINYLVQKKTYICKIIITRGVSNQGYQFRKDIKSTRIVLKNYLQKKLIKKFFDRSKIKSL